MVKLINALTGGEMWVHETRLDEYLAAGHKPAAEPAGASESDTAKPKPKTKAKKPKE
jgi:hypothetical protein